MDQQWSQSITECVCNGGNTMDVDVTLLYQLWAGLHSLKVPIGNATEVQTDKNCQGVN